MTTVPQRRAWLAVGLLIGLGMTGWGGVHVAGWTVGVRHRTDHRVLRAADLSEVRIDAGEGDVTLLPAAGPDVVVDSRAEGSLWMPRLRTSVEGSRVRVHGGCVVHDFGRCRTSIVVHVPARLAVRVSASTGDVTASGLSGRVRLSTRAGDVDASGLSGGADLRATAGDITADRLTGPVRMESRSGDLDAVALRADHLRADATSGDVDLVFATAPGDVDVGATAGDVDLTVPPGGAYAIDAETRSGSRDIGVTDDPRGSRVLRVRATAGDVAIRYGR